MSAEPLKPDAAFVPQLAEPEREEATQRSAIPASVVHEAVREEGEAELRRPLSALAWSGIAAGLSMGFSLVAEGLLRAHLPDAPWRPLLSRFGYSLGFLIVILGRQQLFTENTLTVVLPLLARRTLGMLGQVLRLWGVVLAANLVGAALFAWAAAHTGVFPPEVQAAFRDLGQEAAHGSFGGILLRGIFGGWLIATVVWLMPASEGGARLAVIVLLTYFVGLGGFSHIIAGSVEVLYLVWTGALSLGSFLGGFMLPALLGNTLGGVSLVAALNHAQVMAGDSAARH